MEIQNENPIVYSAQITSNIFDPSIFDSGFIDEDTVDPITSEEVFEYIRHINDPEHPLTLEQLNVVNIDNIHIHHDTKLVEVFFTPTIPHCSMATLIGLCLRIKLLRSMSPIYKIIVKITPGTHQSEQAVNKQLNDKERVAAAIENGHLLDVVNKCIARTDKY